MKTQIILLSPHDDVVSTRDKMTGVSSGRILLIWPRHGRIMTRRLDMALLKRHSQNQGSQLGIVSRDRQILDQATSLGIPAFRNTDVARKYSWRKFRQPSRIKLARVYQGNLRDQRLRRTNEGTSEGTNVVIRWFYFLLAVCSIVILLISLIPSSTVKIALPAINQEATVLVIARPEGSPIEPDSIPYSLRYITVSGEETIQSSGWASAPADVAKGEVILTSLVDYELTIPVGTIVMASQDPDLRYQTKEMVVLTGAPGSKANTRIEALIPGTSGNQPPGMIDSLEGSLGLKITVQNVEAITGGTDQVVRSPTQRDMDALESRIIDRLESDALEKLPTTLTEDETIVPESIHLSRILDRQPTVEVGDPADQITLVLQAELEFGVYDFGAVEEIAAAALDKSLPVGMYAVPDTMNVEFLPLQIEKVSNPGVYTWSVLVTRQMTLPLNFQQIESSVRGRSTRAAYRELEKVYPSVDQLTVANSPAWWPFLSIYPFRIEIQDVNRRITTTDGSL